MTRGRLVAVMLVVAACTRLARPSSAPVVIPPTTTSEPSELRYSVAGRTLSAWVAEPSVPRPQPAVLFLADRRLSPNVDWELARPWRDGNYVVMMPLARKAAESEQLAVEEVLAAADALKALPSVRGDLVFIVGRGARAAQAVAAALRSGRFRAAVAFSGTDDLDEKLEEWHLMDEGDQRPPLRFYTGSVEHDDVRGVHAFAELEQDAGWDVRAETVPGTELTHLNEAIARSITFFREQEPTRPEDLALQGCWATLAADLFSPDGGRMKPKAACSFEVRGPQWRSACTKPDGGTFSTEYAFWVVDAGHLETLSLAGIAEVGSWADITYRVDGPLLTMTVQHRQPSNKNRRVQSVSARMPCPAEP
jgi:dienelactone hydrolase